jgi:hypothetical protein
MKNWKKVCYFAGGVIYASGNLRKLVVNGNQVAAYRISDISTYEAETENSQQHRRGK